MTTIDPTVSRIICLIKIDTDGGQMADDIQQPTDGGPTDGNDRTTFSYFSGYGTSRKHESDHSCDGPYYNNLLAYVRKVKIVSCISFLKCPICPIVMHFKPSFF